MKIRRISGNSYVALSVYMRWFSGYCLRVSHSHLEFTFLPMQTLDVAGPEQLWWL